MKIKLTELGQAICNYIRITEPDNSILFYSPLYYYNTYEYSIKNVEKYQLNNKFIIKMLSSIKNKNALIKLRWLRKGKRTNLTPMEVFYLLKDSHEN